MRIKLRIDDRELRALEAGLKRGDARFAMAKTLTQTAKFAEGVVRSDLPDSFTIRTGWAAKGVRIEPATKARLQSAVGSKDAFMEAQVEGGTKTEKRRMMAIPEEAREPKSAVTPRSKWPGALKKKKAYFINTTKKGSNLALYRRETKDRYPITPIYYFAKSVKIRPRWALREQVAMAARAKFPELLRKNLETEVRRAAQRRAAGLRSR